MAEHCRELIKALSSVADEGKIYVSAKKTVFARGAELASNFGSEEASHYLRVVKFVNGPPKPLSDVISNYLTRSQRIELTNQVIKAIKKDMDVDSSEVVELIVKDSKVKTVALSVVESFIEDRTDSTIDKPPEEPCSIL